MLTYFANMVERAGNCDISYLVLINKKSVSGYYQVNFIIDKAGWLVLGEGEKMLPVFLNYINSNKFTWPLLPSVVAMLTQMVNVFIAESKLSQFFGDVLLAMITGFWK